MVGDLHNDSALYIGRAFFAFIFYSGSTPEVLLSLGSNQFYEDQLLKVNSDF